MVPMKTLRLYGAGLLAALVLTLTACVPSSTGSGGGGGFPDFTLSLNPTSLSAQRGSNGTTQLTITPQNGFTGTVNLSLVGAPSGVTLSPTSVSVTGSDPVTPNLTVSVDSGVDTGTYNLQVKATGGGITRTAALSLTVSAPGGGGGSGGGGGGGGAGTTWTLRNLGNPLGGVAYGNGLFVAVGGFLDSSAILTSPDGVSWTARASGTGNQLLGVTYGNGTFVAVGKAAPSSPQRTG
jgi:hypothetical protein